MMALAFEACVLRVVQVFRHTVELPRFRSLHAHRTLHLMSLYPVVVKKVVKICSFGL